jgi:hypothetical protein
MVPLRSLGHLTRVILEYQNKKLEENRRMVKLKSEKIKETYNWKCM